MSETSSPKALDMGNGNHQQETRIEKCCSFKMPLHYPKFNKCEYENMAEWQLDCLLHQYGLPVNGDVNQKRNYAMGAFLWPSQF
ncbi:hypothetical protein F3Y22_tig00113721pilonHSYRG00167 [Hibiscus syriacus]|uniref:DUF7722 domain-containing protein n=1 Tax=Hibiscus syriacus TaxID=106335 RepID=A0A6A2XJ65_HIBSY|nr:hypothetical protein F3Y22_tig00113721pilonHSYRG00167 [Hibiscus syriacus]